MRELCVARKFIWILVVAVVLPLLVCCSCGSTEETPPETEAVEETSSEKAVSDGETKEFLPGIQGQLASVTETKYEYDADGNVLREEYYVDGNKTGDYCQYEYDDQGVLQRLEMRDSEGTISEEFEPDTRENDTLSGIISEEDESPLADAFSQENCRRTKVSTKGQDPDTLEEYQYDARGNLIRFELTATDGTQSITHEFEYDKNDWLVKCTWSEEVEDGLPGKGSETYQYDSDGKLTECVREEQMQTMPKVQETYKYNSDGDLTEKTETTTEANGEVYSSSKVEYEYNDEYNDNHELIKRTETSYRDGEKEHETVYEYEYYDNGKKKEETRTDSMTGSFSKTSYDKSENPVLIIDVTEENTLEHASEMEYDEHGNVIKETDWTGEL